MPMQAYFSLTFLLNFMDKFMAKTEMKLLKMHPGKYGFKHPHQLIKNVHSHCFACYANLNRTQ